MAEFLKHPDNHSLVAEVMVVDDQQTGRMIVETILRSLGDNVRVISYDNALMALHDATHRTPDLIVADYKMPNLDGVEFTRRIRRLPSCQDVPIVIITVIDDRSVMYQALEAGATDFLTKPVDHYECKVRCQNLLTMRRQQLIIQARANSLEKQIEYAVDKIKLRERETLYRLARAGEFKDYATSAHQARIGRISRIIAEEIGMEGQFCETIESAAPLHDIGKIGVPDVILLKSGPLNPEEMQIMRSHTRIGYEILKDSPSPYLQMGASIALSHHESLDGNGYPSGLRGADIPIEGRIVAVADILDALLSERPYKVAWPLHRALEELENLQGSRLDPACVQALMNRTDDVVEVRTVATGRGSRGG